MNGGRDRTEWLLIVALVVVAIGGRGLMWWACFTDEKACGSLRCLSQTAPTGGSARSTGLSGLAATLAHCDGQKTGP